MDEFLTITGYLTGWIILYHFVIIPRTAKAAFETWQNRLNEEQQLILDITAPVIDEIEILIDNKFSSFFGSISQLGQRAEKLNPANDLKKAIASGDLYSVIAEYVSQKAGIGDLTSLIQPKEGQKQAKERIGLNKE